MSDLFSLVVKGGVVMIPLLLSSVISLAVTIERIVSLVQAGEALKKTTERITINKSAGQVQVV